MKKLFFFALAAACAVSGNAFDFEDNTTWIVSGNYNNRSYKAAKRLQPTADGKLECSIPCLWGEFKLIPGTETDGSFTAYPDTQVGAGENALEVGKSYQAVLYTPDDKEAGKEAPAFMNINSTSWVTLKNATLTFDPQSLTVTANGTPDNRLWVVSKAYNQNSDLSGLPVMESDGNGLYKGVFDFTGVAQFKVVAEAFNPKFCIPNSSSAEAFNADNYSERRAISRLYWSSSSKNLAAELTGIYTVCLDTKSMEIWLDEGDTTSEISAIADNCGEAVYYNLQGVQIDRPSAGMYICRKGNKVSKVILP